ncbi:MAG: hypothetical protein PWQ55_531 [Chloroflexota bacterium]|nr:hypothetical protein [Chloroflexota bacterium]
MKYILSPYAIAQFSTTLVSLIVVVVLWGKRSERGGLALWLLFIALTEWSFCNGMEAAAVSIQTKVLWSQLAYVGAQTSPVFLFLFALIYSSRTNQITPARIALLLIIPIVIIILAATNSLHHWIWTGFSPGAEGSNSIIYHHGPAFWAGMVYIFSLVAFSSTFLFLASVQSQKLYRFQNLLIILASIIPWVSTIMYVSDLNPFPGLDLISLSFFFTGLLLLVGVQRANLLNYIPIAHELLFENIDDGVIVFNENKRVIDMNPGAERLFGVKFSDLIMRKDQSVVKALEFFDDKFSRSETSRFETVSPFNNKVWLNVSISPLVKGRGGFQGWVAILENITLRKETEKELQRINQRLALQLDENRQLEKKLREQANRDAMTGVYNRGCLKDSLAVEISYAEQQNYPLSIVMIDVDNFKFINDTHGHKAGDEVLIALGKMLLAQTRDSDFVSRFGGDEFVMLLPYMDGANALLRAEAWRQACMELKVDDQNHPIKVTISIGIAVYPDNGEELDALLAEADRALYLAKQSGRNCTRVAVSSR